MIRKISYLVLIIGCIAVFFLVKTHIELNRTNAELNEIRIEKERERALKSMYISTVEVLTTCQSADIFRDAELKFSQLEESDILKEEIIVSSNLFIFIPEYSCRDCVESVLRVLKEHEGLVTNKIVVISNFYNKGEKESFIEHYNLLMPKWQLIHAESIFFAEIISNKIFICQIYDDKLIKNCFVYDTEKSNILLKKYLKSKL